MADAVLAVGEKTVKVFPALKMPTNPWFSCISWQVVKKTKNFHPVKKKLSPLLSDPISSGGVMDRKCPSGESFERFSVSSASHLKKHHFSSEEHKYKRSFRSRLPTALMKKPSLSRSAAGSADGLMIIQPQMKSMSSVCSGSWIRNPRLWLWRCWRDWNDLLRRSQIRYTQFRFINKGPRSIDGPDGLDPRVIVAITHAGFASLWSASPTTLYQT